MTMANPERGHTEETTVAAAARAGDRSAFTAVAERYRRELHVHCYRMLGSFDDSEELVQETYLRAWKKRESFQGLSSLRAWLYRIATNACLDFLAQRKHRVLAGEAFPPGQPGAPPPPHVEWLQPYPDRFLEVTARSEVEPDAAIAARETIALAFLVAIQFLPPKQRAVLILRDVLGWSAKEAAELLELSVAAVNSALQRARATLEEHRSRRGLAWAPARAPGDQERALVQRYVDATERNDPAAVAELLRDDVRCSMPPHPETRAGRDAVVGWWVAGGFGSQSIGEFRCAITSANRMPAVACYLRAPGDSAHRALALDVLQIQDGLIAEVTVFPLQLLLEPLDLPATM